MMEFLELVPQVVGMTIQNVRTVNKHIHHRIKSIVYLYLNHYTMGLDTVELVMEFEKYFEINIPDREAEQMTTLQQATDTIARHRQITSDEMTLQTNILNQVSNCISQILEIQNGIKLSDLISTYLSAANKDAWNRFTALMTLNVPKPYCPQQTDGFITKLKNHIMMPLYNWNTLTVEDFVYSVGAANFTTLVNSKTINTKYEIAIAVAGLTVDKSGVDFYEVAPGKSFTNDLGMD
jgi:hypothetical protein